MIQLVRTDAKNEDFIHLVAKLDADLVGRDGEDHAFYNQFNSINSIKSAVIAYYNAEVAGCGAIKEHDANSMEVKRMYVRPEARGMGIATKILRELEKWTSELGYSSCVLETGKKQPEAIALYEKNSYQQIPNYGQYQGIENSLCFQKNVSS